jgi:hypothetical protein
MDAVWVNHNGIVRVTKDTILFSFADSPLAIPKSIIVAYTELDVTIPQWFAEKHKLDWNW